ncbi:MAG: TolC family protein, partial [Muribaculaceae bacterium]|nr:TolC family protein [Muribaculaceae bacterium]
WSVSVVQSFDWPGVYRSRSKAAAAGAQAERLLYLAEELDMRLRVSNVLTDYIAACMQLNLCQTISDNLSVIAEKVESAFNHGESTILDYRKIGFEKIEAAAATDAATSLVVSLRQELIALNGGKNVNLDQLTAFPQFELNTSDYYIQTQMAADPAVLAGEYLSEAAVQNVKSASRNNLPGFSLGYIHNVEIGDHFNGIKVGVSLPFFANRHRKAEAKARLQATQNELFDTELAVTQRVLSDYSKAALLDARLDQYAKLFPDSGDDYLTLLRKSYDVGQMSLIIYLYEVNYYTEARAAYINLLHDRALSMLSLSRFN